MSAEPVTFVDEVFAAQSQNVDAYCGDFVIARADGVFAYQLAVVVDDIAMHIEEVVRGADLLTSTPRQMPTYCARLDAAPLLYFTHLPIITADGEKTYPSAGAAPYA